MNRCLARYIERIIVRQDIDSYTSWYCERGCLVHGMKTPTTSRGKTSSSSAI